MKPEMALNAQSYITVIQKNSLQIGIEISFR